MNVECVAAEICHLGECPVWHPVRRRLYWTDGLRGRIWEYDPAARAHRLFGAVDEVIGGFTFSPADDLILCTNRGVRRLRAQNPALQPAVNVALGPGERFNDIAADPRGRLFAGTLKTGGQGGVLYRLEKGKEPVVVLEDIGISNGMAWSADQTRFFHTDSRRRRISVFDYDLGSGAIARPRQFFQGAPDQGLPDGITVDAEDCVWAAFWGGSCVRCISPRGRVKAEIKLPARQPSSVAFGGNDLRDLYITSACQGGSDLERGLGADGRFLGGPLYRVRLEVAGRPDWWADL